MGGVLAPRSPLFVQVCVFVNTELHYIVCSLNFIINTKAAVQDHQIHRGIVAEDYSDYD
jgi:hypothetical protein